MRRTRTLSLAILLAAASFTVGAWWAHWRADTAQRQAVAAYACPMHPQYRSDHPGDCPSCGMRLEPVRAEGAGTAGGGIPLLAGAMRVSPDRQQRIGVRLGVVERVSGTRTLRTTGRVTPNENAVYPLVAGADGLVRGMRGVTTGALVKRSEILLSFYAPEFVNTQLSYFSGL